MTGSTTSTMSAADKTQTDIASTLFVSPPFRLVAITLLAIVLGVGTALV